MVLNPQSWHRAPKNLVIPYVIRSIKVERVSFLLTTSQFQPCLSMLMRWILKVPVDGGWLPGDPTACTFHPHLHIPSEKGERCWSLNSIVSVQRFNGSSCILWPPQKPLNCSVQRAELWTRGGARKVMHPRREHLKPSKPFTLCISFHLAVTKVYPFIGNR